MGLHFSSQSCPQDVAVSWQHFPWMLCLIGKNQNSVILLILFKWLSRCACKESVRYYTILNLSLSYYCIYAMADCLGCMLGVWFLCLFAQTVCLVLGLFARSHFASIQTSSKMRRMSKKFVPHNLPCDFSHMNTWVCAIVSIWELLKQISIETPPIFLILVYLTHTQLFSIWGRVSHIYVFKVRL